MVSVKGSQFAVRCSQPPAGYCEPRTANRELSAEDRRRRSFQGGSALWLRLRAASGSLCLLFCCWTFAGADVATAVRGVQKRYAAVESVSAEFRQTYRAPGIDQTESGTLVMKKPGLMRWEYRSPETKLFIADGRNTYFYSPEDRQVLLRSFSSADLRSTPLQFLLGRGNILGSFLVSWEKEFRPGVEGTLLLRLVPRTAEPDYEFLVIECDERTFDLRRIIIRERTGNTSEFRLSNMVTNIKVDKKQFQFKIPKGVEVVRLDEK